MRKPMLLLACSGTAVAESFSSLEQSQGLASGGQNVTLHGVDLEPAGVYKLRFTDIWAPERFVESSMSFLSSSALEGTQPAWTYQAAATTLSLRRDGVEVPKDGTGTYHYNIIGASPCPSLPFLTRQPWRAACQGLHRSLRI